MKSKLNTTEAAVSKTHKRKAAWQNFVRTMAMVVIFCTTYALILPAITMEPDLICTLPEHTHSESCWQPSLEQELICTLSEEAPELHQHHESCFTQPELICGTDETEGHLHDETCRTEETLVCEIPETEPHAHSESCLSQPELVCAISEEPVEPHRHAEACWTEKEVTRLICNLDEHAHEDACYKQQTEGEQGITYGCGFTAHAHGETCHDEGGGLICTIPEHTHEASCAAAVDPAADLESSEDWLTMIAGLEFTGSWREDLLTVARSQIGYAESADNCILDGDELKGYTRYGDWYGNPYMAWDDVFIAFCLHYAGIPESEIPRDSDTDTWLAKLAQQGLTHGTADQLPQPGDIVFYKNAGGKLHTAIVENAESPDLEALQFRVIAGDSNDKVEKVLITLDSVAAVCDPDAESAAPEVTEPEATEPEATEPQLVVHTAETENYIVTVSHPGSLVLPEGTQLRVMEYTKDSETYILRCQEAGYELDWLLNIGFFLGEEELNISGGFDVVVTSKQGEPLGQDITHFADSGTERIEAEGEEGSVSFTSGGFSDFGGGIALLSADPGDSYQMVVDDPTKLKTGVNYVLYCPIDTNGDGTADRIVFLNSNLSATTVQADAEAFTRGGSWGLSSGEIGSASIFWQIEKNGDNTYLTINGQRLTLHNGWIQLTSGGTALHFNARGDGAYVGGERELRYDDSWRATWNGVTSPTTVYFSSVYDFNTNYPHAVHTGEVKIDRLRFYNLVENGDKGVGPLAGCTFEITGANGYKATVVSQNDPELHLPSTIPDGDYTITEISTPAGYVRDKNHTRTFTVKDGALVSDRTIGTFLNHSMEQLETSKTAEVEDYANRIYQIDMTAKSNMRHFVVDPLDLLFVVDQSNSMLFPSGLVDTGKKVTLNRFGTNNVSNINKLNLDRSQVYYIIADPHGTSTVWAVWHDGENWLCQDASYYAKAKHANEFGYQDDNETVIFPDNLSYADQKKKEANNVRSNGGGLGLDLTGSSLGTHLEKVENKSNTDTFTIYTATNQFNRLHYLEEALTNLIYQLADVSSENRVSLTRFTKVVNTNDCFGPYNMTPDNAEELAYQVQHIKTSGGTRQDIALQHVYQQHLRDSGEHYHDMDHTYTLLITDGAPVFSSGTGPEELGKATDEASTTSKTVYGRIKGWANEVKKESTLLTVALGMESVDAGRQVLEEIATKGGNNFCAANDAAEMMDFVQGLLFKSFKPGDYIHYEGDITDEISDSFYPIAWTWRGQGAGTGNRVLTSDGYRDWVLLEAGDWITLDGQYTTAGASNAAGQLLQRENGTFYVKWTGQTVSGSGWSGRFYVKAKEDFIGGNAIDTNKQAGVTVDGSTESLDTPTVNVRLLDMNEMNSEVTVYLGDQVNGEGNSPQHALKYFYDNTKFTKLISDEGKVLNKIAIDSAKGLEAAEFYLRYAMGADLTDVHWAALLNGNIVEVPYTYDDASSHGPVGYFTFKLEKTGLGSNYNQHEALAACQPGGQPLTENCDSPVETYTLHVTYTAYRLGQNGRPSANVHNSASGPGREVGTGTTLENGLGVVAKQNVHEVHVISGRIEIIKKFADGVTDAADRTFSFTLHRAEDGTDASRDVTKTITIPAGKSAGSVSIVFDGLRRGTYTVTEAVDEDYTVKGITVLDTTNSYTEPPIGTTATQLVAVMGNNVSNQNVIGLADPADRYVSYIDPVNGVYAAAEFTNTPIIYTADIPVVKIWDDGSEHHSLDNIYVVLHLNGSPVLDADGNARMLRLNQASDWSGVFTVILANKDDSLSNYDYSVREVSGVRLDPTAGWHPALIENAGASLIYYEKTVEDGKVLSLDGKGYVVRYGVDSDGKLTVTNGPAYELPKTGGHGTHLYTISGLLFLLAAAWMYTCNFGRKRQRGGRNV